MYAPLKGRVIMESPDKDIPTAHGEEEEESEFTPEDIEEIHIVTEG